MPRVRTGAGAARHVLAALKAERSSNLAAIFPSLPYCQLLFPRLSLMTSRFYDHVIVFDDALRASLFLRES